MFSNTSELKKEASDLLDKADVSLDDLFELSGTLSKTQLRIKGASVIFLEDLSGYTVEKRGGPANTEHPRFTIYFYTGAHKYAFKMPAVGGMEKKHWMAVVDKYLARSSLE